MKEYLLKCWKLLVSIAVIWYLLSMLVGCATKVVPDVRIIEDKEPIPAQLLRECKYSGPELESGSTNGDLAEAYRAARGDIDSCNADKDAIKAWQEDRLEKQ